MKRFHFSFLLGLSFVIISCTSSLSRAASVFDDFVTTSAVAITADTGSSATLGQIPGQNGNAAILNYSLGTGNFAVMYKEYTSRDFANEGGNAVRFRYKAVGNVNTFEAKFTDFDSTSTASLCDKLSYKFLTQPDNQWRTLTLAFSTFTLFGDGNSSFNLTQVSRLSLGLTQDNSTRGSGTIFLDRVELYKSTETLIDNFEDAAEPNFFSGTNLNTFASGGGTAAASYVTLGTDRVLQMTYDVSAAGSFSGIFLNLARNFQGYTHLSFRVRGNVGGEVVKVKLESAAGNNEVFISTYLTGGITTAFQRVFVPVTAFSSVNFSSVNVITYLLENSIASGAGTVWFDDIGFVRRNETPGVVRVLDDLDADFNSTNWDIYTHTDASLSVLNAPDASVAGAAATNRVFQLNYAFTVTPAFPAQTPYAVIDRTFQLSIAPFSVLRFRYFGTASANNIEFKLVDDDNTTWIKKFYLASNTNGVWKTATIPVQELSLFSNGTDSYLNMKRIKKVEFAISRGSGGSGTFAVDTFESSDTGEFQVDQPDRVISSFRLVNNPFSPNGDGIKDEVFFAYTLSVASKVTLKIYSLQGDEVLTVFNAQQSAGEQSISWNGNDRSGSKVSNGLYIFRLEAEGADHRNDVIRQIVGALR